MTNPQWINLNKLFLSKVISFVNPKWHQEKHKQHKYKEKTACNTFERSWRRGSRAATLEVWVDRCPARENVFGPGVQVSRLLTNPTGRMVILEDLPSNISGSMKKDWKEIQLLVFLAGPTRPCQISASPPSCKASRPFLKAAAATQRGMERKTCCSVSNNDKLCGQRQASAPEVWWCPIKSEDFL